MARWPALSRTSNHDRRDDDPGNLFHGSISGTIFLSFDVFSISLCKLDCNLTHWHRFNRRQRSHRWKRDESHRQFFFFLFFFFFLSRTENQFLHASLIDRANPSLFLVVRVFVRQILKWINDSFTRRTVVLVHATRARGKVKLRDWKWVMTTPARNNAVEEFMRERERNCKKISVLLRQDRCGEHVSTETADRFLRNEPEIIPVASSFQENASRLQHRWTRHDCLREREPFYLFEAELG